jgi:hypothetical protein
MPPFRLLTRTRQATEYSCGACALQAVLRYWGKDVDETELMRLMGTNDAVGTYPENMVRGVHALGLQAEARENLTLDEVRSVTDQGHPVIGLAQVWRSASASPGSPRDEWDSGHYIVILGVDNDYVYIQDPYVRMAKAFVPRPVFEEHWHQIMGGKATGNRTIERCAVFVTGERPAGEAAEASAALPPISFESIASISVVTLRFEGALLPYDFMTELKEALPPGIRASAFVFLRRDSEGRLLAFEGGQLEDEAEIRQVNALIAGIASQGLDAPVTEQTRSKMAAAVEAAASGDFGLSLADLMRLGESVPPGQAAMVLLFENLWEQRLKDLAAAHGGRLAAQRLVPAESLARLGRQLHDA